MGLGQCPAGVRHVTPRGARGRHERCVCACRCGCVLVEVQGSVGQSDLESCYVGCRRANRNHQSCANLTLGRPMREKNKENQPSGKHTAQGSRWGPQLDSPNQQRQPWVLWKSHSPPPPSGVPWLPRREVQTPTVSAHGGMGRLLGSLSQGKTSSIWGPGEGAVPLGAPSAVHQQGEGHEQIPVLGAGEGWLPKPWRDAQVHKTRTGLPAEGGRKGVVWEGKVQQHRSHSEHNTMGQGQGQGGNQTKARSCALGSQAPRAAA